MPPYSMHALNAFLVTVVLIHLLQPVSHRFGLIDLPNGRKLHEGGVPVIGGIAMFIGFIVPILAGGGAVQPGWNLLGGLAILVALGAIDDAQDLPPTTKVVVQVTAALVMVLPDGRLIESLGHLPLLGAVSLGPLALPATVLFIVTVINAVNMFDGLDGQAGGTAAITLAALGLASDVQGHDDRMASALLILFAVAGFLVFNLRHPWRLRASCFMGDAGSMMLGAAIAFLTFGVVADFSTSAAPDSPPLAAVGWILGLPLIDMASLIVRRLKAGCNPMRADRRHLHHLIVDSGVRPGDAVLAILSAHAVLAAIGIGGWMLGAPEHLLAAGLVVPVAAHALFVRFGVRLLRSRIGDAVAAAVPAPHDERRAP